MGHWCEDCRGNTGSGSPCSDACEDCYCENPDERDLLTEDGEGCFHLMKDECDCKRCDCDCHRDNEPDEPDFDPLDNDTSDWL